MAPTTRILPSELEAEARSAPTGLSVISVSMDLGAGRRGVDMGPSAIRIAGLSAMLEGMGYEIREVGTVTASGPETADPGDSRTRYLAEVSEVCKRSHALVKQSLDHGSLPLVLGGDHSLSIGTVSAVSAHYAKGDESIGLIWVDAHTDMNTPETTPSGNIHGMALAILTGQGGPEHLQAMAGFNPAVHPGNACVIGARDVDPPEKDVVRESGIRVFTMAEIDERGMAACMDEAIARVTSGTAGFHLSFDLDSIDPMVAPGVGTPVAGGLTYREAHLVCEKVARSERLVSLEVVELNPVLDAENRTGKLAIGLMASALGKTIL
jgi:arginase